MNTNHNVEQRRQDYLDALYLLDGRDHPSHPAHATYTGLFIKHVETLIDHDMREVLAAINPAA